MKKSIYILALLALVSCQFTRKLLQKPSITDYKKFPARDVHANSRPDYFSKTLSSISSVPKSLVMNGKELPFDAFLKENKTVAFLIIRNDTMLYENYFSGFDSSTQIASFGIANAITSMIIGCAIEDGYINSVNDPVTKYIPELSKNGYDQVTLKNLLQMTSGMDFKESYSDPFAEGANFYFGSDLEERCKHLTLKVLPGSRFEYLSGNTQLLGLVLKRVLHKEPITHYFERKIWMHLSTEHDASWSTDKKEDGLEKTFCCFNVVARDLAKLGKLALNEGNWNGKQLVPKKWMQDCKVADMTQAGAQNYKYHWWLLEDGAFAAQGQKGQYLYVYPKKKVIIVRLGSDYGTTNWNALFQSYVQNIP
jgi:CubicO group peptidase (beta-lactamase class C family)